MPRAITKVRPLPGERKPVATSRSALVDEFGRIQSKLGAMKALERRHEQLREVINGWYASADPEVSFNEEGKDFGLHIGPRARKRVVADLAKLHTQLGVKRFLGLVTVSLEKLDRLIAPADQEGLVREDRTGSRQIRAIAKYRETAA